MTCLSCDNQVKHQSANITDFKPWSKLPKNKDPGIETKVITAQVYI